MSKKKEEKNAFEGMIIEDAELNVPRTGLQEPHVILINGPPGSGKDTAAEAIKSTYHCGLTPVVHEKFSTPLKLAVCSLFNVTMEELEEMKDAPGEKLMAVPGREWQIAISEEVVKHNSCRPHAFAELFDRRIKAMMEHARAADRQKPSSIAITPIIVVSDCGFQEEADYISTLYDCGLIRLSREGSNYDGDSRGVVSPNNDMKWTTNIHANTVDELTAKVLADVLRHVRVSIE